MPATVTADGLLTPSRIGRFHILRELGSGASSSVYLVQDPLIDRQVALKTCNPRLPANERSSYQQQLINEARAAGRLSHPYIVTILDAASEHDSAYIVMEYLSGRELHKLLAGRRHFSALETAQMVSRIAQALAYAHQQGVIHRDVKPANIFVLHDNRPKLMDFGIARAPNRVPAPAAAQPYTLFHRNLLGTPNYMSPEQALGKPVDCRTDVYSLGAVLYEMLTGRKPFASTDTEQLLQQIAYQAPPAPDEINPHANPPIPPELSAIAMKALAKRPEKRYQSAHDMNLALRHYLARQKRQRPRPAQMPATVAEPMLPAPAAASPPRLLWLGGAALAAVLLVLGAGALLR